MKQKVIIIGAGPAGLTAAYELARDGKYLPILLEASDTVGGISRTVEYKGNRIDIGGHRFFSKSDWVMEWWRSILPFYSQEETVEIFYHGKRRVTSSDIFGQKNIPNDGKVFLVRNRLSRIYYLRRYFDYPISLSANTLKNLGLWRAGKIGLSYLFALAFPRRPEVSLEDFLINRFGKTLYLTFFKDYTEKVWGVPCNRISAEWGAQRIKGLSIIEALLHAIRKSLNFWHSTSTPKTSLIEKFLYPRLGPGQLWQEVARKVVDLGGVIHFNVRAVEFSLSDGRITYVEGIRPDGERVRFDGEFFISTMPVKDLVAGISPSPPPEVIEIAKSLPYRDFITVGLLLRKMKRTRDELCASDNNMPPDNWIYIQEPNVRIGRLQIFNNWSPDLVADQKTIWLGLEYFCQQDEDLWSMNDKDLIDFAATELEKIGMIDKMDVIDGTVIRVPKAYPAYFGSYEHFSIVKEWLDKIENLFLVGRNGMHRYNNQDHSMLTAKLAVDAILSGTYDKSEIWKVNIDDDYHEEKNN